jgi:hypothetical protein
MSGDTNIVGFACWFIRICFVVRGVDLICSTNDLSCYLFDRRERLGQTPFGSRWSASSWYQICRVSHGEFSAEICWSFIICWEELVSWWLFCNSTEIDMLRSFAAGGNLSKHRSYCGDLLVCEVGAVWGIYFPLPPICYFVKICWNLRSISEVYRCTLFFPSLRSNEKIWIDQKFLFRLDLIPHILLFPLEYILGLTQFGSSGLLGINWIALEYDKRSFQISTIVYSEPIWPQKFSSQGS